MKPARQLQIVVKKMRGIGDLPNYIHMGHRHLQKAPSTAVPVGGGAEFSVPIDLLHLTTPTTSLWDDVVEVRFGYKA